jgi:hypothetical protein
MGILHCAAQNSHVNVMNFIFESLENLNVNEIEKVCGVIHIVHTNVYFAVRTKH